MPFYFSYSLHLATNSSLKWCRVIVTIKSYLIISNDLSFLLDCTLPNLYSLFLCFIWMDLLQQDRFWRGYLIVEAKQFIDWKASKVRSWHKCRCGCEQKTSLNENYSPHFWCLYNQGTRRIFSRILDLRLCFLLKRMFFNKNSLCDYFEPIYESLKCPFSRKQD